MSWLAAAAAVTLLAVDLVWPARMGLALLIVATGLRTVWSFVLLRGPRAVHALEWRDAEGERNAVYFLWLGDPGRRLPAAPAGCRKYGMYFWILRFETPEGIRQLLVNTSCQDPAALRRLSRCLHWGSGLPAGASGGW